MALAAYCQPNSLLTSEESMSLRMGGKPVQGTMSLRMGGKPVQGAMSLRMGGKPVQGMVITRLVYQQS